MQNLLPSKFKAKIFLTGNIMNKNMYSICQECKPMQLYACKFSLSTAEQLIN